MYADSKKIPLQVKSEVDDDCVDLHPFDIVSGKGFTCMAQGLNIGVRNEAIKANSVIPRRQTVCERAKEATTEKSESIKKALDAGGAAITTDMWTDDFNKKGRHPAYFLTDDWQLKSHVIASVESDAYLRKTAENIHEQISKELNDFGNPGERLSRVVFVTKMQTKAALRIYHWIPYTAHVLNTRKEGTTVCS